MILVKCIRLIMTWTSKGNSNASIHYPHRGGSRNFFDWSSSHQLVAVRKETCICWLHSRLFSDANWGLCGWEMSAVLVSSSVYYWLTKNRWGRFFLLMLERQSRKLESFLAPRLSYMTSLAAVCHRGVTVCFAQGIPSWSHFCRLRSVTLTAWETLSVHLGCQGFLGGDLQDFLW